MPRRRLAQDPARMLRTALGGALVAAHCAALFGVASGSESQSTQRSPSVGLPRISLDGVRPFLNSVLQGNGTVVAAAGAAWGVRALRHAAERSNIQERVERLFNKGTDAGGPLPFQAVTTDPKGVPTTIPSGSEFQWMPAEWHEASKGLHSFNVPAELARATEGFSRATGEMRHTAAQTAAHLSEQARQQWRNGEAALQLQVKGLEHQLEKQMRGISRVGSFSELREDFAQRLEDSALELQRMWGEAPFERISESTAQRLRAWQEKVSTHIDTLRVGLRPAHRQAQAELRAAQATVQQDNQALHDRLFSVLNDEGWEHVLSEDGVDVYRKKILDVPGGEKFYCIKATGVIAARAHDLYDVLKDSSRVEEYNDECEDIRELEALSEDTRVTWAASKTYFPFKPREVITRVHNTQLQDGTYVIMSKSEDVDSPAYTGKDFVRTEVLLAGNVMRPCKDDPDKTEFTTIAHINPGGAAETSLGAQITNRICTHGPVSFIRKLEQVANANRRPGE